MRRAARWSTTRCYPPNPARRGAPETLSGIEHHGYNVRQMSSQNQPGLYVTGADGCAAGWVCFKVDTCTLATTVEIIADISARLGDRPKDIAVLAIDVPIGLLDGPRRCDRSARKLLGFPRCTSVFSPPCRGALSQSDYAHASQTNLTRTLRRLTIQAWAITPKIKHLDDVIRPEHQAWVYEVHPEVSFWCLNNCTPMAHSKSRVVGRVERLSLLKRQFPEIERHVSERPNGVRIDDLLDAAVAAWSGMRIWQGMAESVCIAERDAKGLAVSIHY